MRQWRETLRADEIAQEQHIVEANDPGAFYRFVNKRLAGRSSVGAIVSDDGSIFLTDNHMKANAFNKYFAWSASVGVADNGTVPVIRNVALSETLDSVTVGETYVLNSINKLKCNLSAGPDGLPPMLFKKLKYCLTKPLAICNTVK